MAAKFKICTSDDPHNQGYSTCSTSDDPTNTEIKQKHSMKKVVPEENLLPELGQGFTPFISLWHSTILPPVSKTILQPDNISDMISFHFIP